MDVGWKEEIGIDKIAIAGRHEYHAQIIRCVERPGEARR